MTPQGHTFNQSMAEEFSKEEELVILCGHYEGIDERALELIVTDYVSIGDYVLTGGELPAMVVIDSVSRLVPGVLNNEESARTESFSDGLLEYPQYTRPADYKGLKVPDVLLSGHHGKIEEWRHEKSLERTKKYRPDLYEEYQMGAAAAKADEAQCRALEQYAYGLGLAFQIVDDVLDVTSTPEQLGKPIGSDSENGKTTFVTLYGAEGAMKLAHDLNQETCTELHRNFGEKAAFLEQLAQQLLVRKN